MSRYCCCFLLFFVVFNEINFFLENCCLSYTCDVEIMICIIFLMRLCHNLYMLCFLENMLPLIFFSLRVENVGECKFAVRRSEFVSVGGVSEQLLMRLTVLYRTDLGKCTQIFVALVSTFP